MPKKMTDQDGVMARQLADAMSYAIQHGKYMPLAAVHYHGGASSLDVMTQGALSQLLTIAALDGSLQHAESTDELILLLSKLRKSYPELADMVDFVSRRLQSMETKRKTYEHEQWIAASMEPSIKSGELFKRLNYLISR